MESVADLFAKLASANPRHEPMLRFVSQMAASDHAEALFPVTSRIP